MKYSVIAVYFCIFLFIYIFPTLIISNAGLGTEAEKVEKLSPLFFSIPRNSLVCWFTFLNRRMASANLEIVNLPDSIMKVRLNSSWNFEILEESRRTYNSQQLLITASNCNLEFLFYFLKQYLGIFLNNILWKR